MLAGSPPDSIAFPTPVAPVRRAAPASPAPGAVIVRAVVGDTSGSRFPGPAASQSIAPLTAPGTAVTALPSVVLARSRTGDSGVRILPIEGLGLAGAGAARSAYSGYLEASADPS